MTMENSSPITVLMSVHNGMPYLPAAVKSVFDQTYGHWQLLIINDGSSDGSGEYLDQLDDSRVRVIHQNQQGLAAALNRGIESCETELVARLDSDDIALPERLERQLAFMRQHPEVGLLGTQFKRLGSQRAGFPSRLPCDHRKIMAALMEGQHAMCHPTIVCRTELLRQVGGYWQHPIAQDWDVYLKFGERSQLANLDEVLLHYRIHDASLNGKRLAAIRHHQRYAAECARRRQQDLDPIVLEKFSQIEQDRRLSWRLTQRLNERAMEKYRQGLANILGGRPTVGYLQLGLAATCSPSLTKQRLQRIGRFQRLSQVDSSRQSSSSSEPVN